SSCEIICFSNGLAFDAITDKLRAHAASWHDIAGLKDDAAAELIRAQRIDVLIDLAVHTSRNRLLVFARKPAPIQATYLGYPGTTGMSVIDYRLTDPHLDPPGNERFYLEKSLHLPHSYWCFEPPANAPDVDELPARRNGFVQFGCMNFFAKLSDA